MKKDRVKKESSSSVSDGMVVDGVEVGVLLPDSCLELRKREAAKPLYLIRYE